MEKIKLLLVEDDENLAFMEKSTLEDIIGDYEIMVANNGKEGYQAWKSFKPDVIISDIDMPIMDGIEMVKRIRELDKDTIILFTTNIISPTKLEEGYAVGADNYIKKPFVPVELDAHVKNIMRLKKGQKSSNISNCIKIGKHIFDSDHAFIKDENNVVCAKLTPKESQVLKLLAQNKNTTVLREAIQEHFWNTSEKDFYISRRLDIIIATLRKHLRLDSAVSIKTDRGIGFSLVETLVSLFLIWVW